MTRVTVDDAELRTLSVDLRGAAAKVQGQVRPLVQVGAFAIKKQMQAEMSRSRSFKGVAGSITYDTRETSTTVTAEIGPTVGGGSGGSLANIAYFGGSRGGGTVPDPQGALDVEAPKLEKAIADLMGRLL